MVASLHGSDSLLPRLSNVDLTFWKRSCLLLNDDASPSSMGAARVGFYDTVYDTFYVILFFIRGDFAQVIELWL